MTIYGPNMPAPGVGIDPSQEWAKWLDVADLISIFAKKNVYKTPLEFGASGGGADDTAAIQAAFDDGAPIILDQNYYVSSVEIKKMGKVVDFNGYQLIGLSSTPNTDSVLKITGAYLKLYQVFVNANFNTNYKCAIHWYSPYSSPAQHNKIFGLHTANTIVGMQYGAFFDEALPNNPQSENYIYEWSCRGVQQVLNTWQQNGLLTVIGGTLDCNPNEWEANKPGVFSQADAYLFDNRTTELFVTACELLKTSSQSGTAMRGKEFTITNCKAEIACKWFSISGNAKIHGMHGLQSSDANSIFTIESASSGRLDVFNFKSRRGAGGSYSGAYIMTGIGSSPDFKVEFVNCEFQEWNAVRYSDAKTSQVGVKNSLFWYMNAGSRIESWIDQIKRVDTLPTAGDLYLGTTVSVPRVSGGEDTLYTCIHTGSAYVWRTIQTNKNGATASRPTSLNTGESFYDTTLNKPLWWNGSTWVQHTRWVSVPASATATGNPGDIAADAGFLYICTSTNTWRRVAIASW